MYIFSHPVIVRWIEKYHQRSLDMHPHQAKHGMLHSAFGNSGVLWSIWEFMYAGYIALACFHLQSLVGRGMVLELLPLMISFSDLSGDEKCTSSKS